MLNSRLFLSAFCIILCIELQATAPTITSFSPQSGIIGSSVVITGTNFDTSIANNIVYFGPVTAMVTAATATSLTVQVPSGASFSRISVTTGGLTALSKGRFTVTFSPTGIIDATALTTTATLQANSLLAEIGDVDGDGKPDIVYGNSDDSKISIFRNTSTVRGALSSASFQSTIDFNVGTDGSNRVNLADIDGDGKLDLVVGNVLSNVVSILRNTSSPGNVTASSFAAPVNITVTRACKPAVADLNGDGKPEIIVASANNSYITILQNSTTPGVITSGSFVSSTLTTGMDANYTTAADLNNDGKPDILAANSGEGNFTIFENLGSGGTISFGAKVSIPTPDGTGTNHLDVADLDADGKLDIVSANYSAFVNQVSVYKNNYTSGAITTSSFSGPISFADGAFNTSQLAIADFDGDLKPDFITVGDTQASIFKNTTPAGVLNTSSFVRTAFPSSNAISVSIGDLNGDGRTDAVTSPSSGIQILRNGIGPAPVINSFTPGSSRQNKSIVISGSNFDDQIENVKVTFTNVDNLDALVTATSATSITVTVPTGTATGPIKVKVDGKTATSNTFTFISPPVISFSTPSIGYQGSDISITGSNFDTTPANNIVKVNSVNAAVSSSTATQLNVRIPIGATSGKISVRIDTDEVISLSNVTVLYQTITNVSPTSALPQATVTLTGTNFSIFSSDNVVQFNGVTATLASPATSTTLKAIVPANATTGPITVKIKDYTASSPGNFNVEKITGLEENLPDDVLVYPNPTKNRLLVDLNTFSENLPVSVIIYDTAGRTITKQHVPGKSLLEIDTSQFTSGLYILRAIQNERVLVKKVMRE